MFQTSRTTTGSERRTMRRRSPGRTEVGGCTLDALESRRLLAILTFVSGGTSNWFDAGNWSNGVTVGHIPGPGDTALIPDLGVASAVITYNGSSTVGAITVGNNRQVDFAGGSLNVGSVSFGNGNATVSGTSIVLLSPFVKSSGGTFRFSGGSITGNVVSTANQVIAVSTAGAVAFDCVGTTTFSGAIGSAQSVVSRGVPGVNASFIATSVGGLGVQGVLTLESTGNGGSFLTVNTGELTIGSGGTVNINAGSGTGRSVNANVTNRGTLNINTPVSFSRSSGLYANFAALNINPGGSLSISSAGQVFSQNSGAIAGASGLLLDSVTFNLNGGTVAGTLTVTNCAVNIDQGATDEFDLVVRGTTTLTGDLRQGQTLQSLGVPGLSASLTINTAGGFSNRGVLILDSSGNGGSFLTLGTGAFRNEQGGVFSIRATGSVTGRTVSADLVNNGEVSITAPVTFSRGNGSYVNFATFTIGAGGSLGIGAGSQTFTQSGGVLTTANALSLDSLYFNYLGGQIAGTPVLTNCSVNLGEAATAAVALQLRGTTNLTGNIGPGQSIHNMGVPGLSASLIVNTVGGFSNEGSLTLDSSGNGGSFLTVNSGVFVNEGVFTIAATAGNTGRSVSANLENHGTVTITAPTTFSRGSGQYTNFGSFSIGENGSLGMGSQGQILTLAGGVFSTGNAFTGDSMQINILAGAVVGVPVLTSCSVTLAPEFTGALNLSLRGTTTFSGNLRSNHAITAMGVPGLSASLNIVTAGGFSNSGVVTLDSTGNGGSFLNVLGGPLVNNVGGLLVVNVGSGTGRSINSDLTNNGTVTLHAATALSSASGLYVNNGVFTVAPGGSLSIGGQAQIFTQNSGHFQTNNATFFDSLHFNYLGGTVTGTPILTNCLVNFSPAATAPIDLTLRGTTTFSGTVLSGQSLLVQGVTGLSATLLVNTPGGLTNQGTITLDSFGNGASFLTVNTGVLTNAPGATITSNLGSGTGRSINAHLTNQGTVNINAATTLSRGDGLYVNSGILSVNQGGSLSISGAGQVFTMVSGLLSTNGAVSLDSMYFNYLGGTVTGTPTMTNCSVSFAPGVLTPISVLFRGTTTFAGNLEPGQSIVSAGVPSLSATLNITTGGGFTNRGTLVLDSTGNGGSFLNVLAGRFVNAPGGVLEFAVGSGTGRSMNADLTNQGTVLLHAPTTFSRSAGQYVNRGALTVDAGATLTIAGASQVFTQQSGQVNGDGAVVFDSIVFNYVGGGVTIPSKTLTHCAVNFAPTATAPIDLTLRGNTTFTGHLLTGQRLTNLGIQSLSATLTVVTAGGMNNQGMITLDSTSNGGSFIESFAGAFVNAPGGVINVNVGSGTGRSFGGDLINNGSIFVNAALTLSRSGAIYTNNANLTVGPGGSLTVNGGGQVFTQNMGMFASRSAFTSSGMVFNYLGGTVTGTLVFTNQYIAFGSGGTNPISMITRGTTSFAGSIREGQTVTNEGVASLSATFNTISGNGFTLGGTLVLNSQSNGASSVNVGGTGVLTVTPSGTLRSEVGSGTGRSVSAQMNNSGTVQLNAPTAWPRTNVQHQNTGTLSVRSGTSTFSGEFFTNEGQVVMGSDGTLTINSGFLAVGSAQTTVEIGGESPGVNLGRLIVNASAQLGGSVQPVLVNGFSPALGATFTFVSATSTAGSAFSSVLPTVPGSSAIGFEVSVTPTTAFLTAIAVTPPTNPVDFNGDGLISPDDLDDFITSFFSDPPDPRTDFNNDGLITPDDLDDYVTAYFG